MIALVMFVIFLYMGLTPIMILDSLIGPVGFYGGFIVSIFSLHILISFIIALAFRFSHDQFRILARISLIIDVILPFSLVTLFALAVSALTLGGGGESGFFLAAILSIGYIGLVGLLNRIFGKRLLNWIRMEGKKQTKTDSPMNLESNNK